MKLLAIDSCSNVATGAVLCDGVLTAEFVINDKKTHSVKLLPQVEQMLQSVDLAIADIDYFACTVGPGSFTGQRIGVATVKGLAHGAQKPAIGVSSLESMAYNLPGASGLICPIMDARREQVYTGTYRWQDGGLQTVNGDRAIGLDQLLDELKGQAVTFLGDGVPVFKEHIASTLGGMASFAPAHLLHLRGGSVAQCAWDAITQGQTCSYDQLQPSYLRLSQAEREYNDRLEQQRGGR